METHKIHGLSLSSSINVFQDSSPNPLLASGYRVQFGIESKFKYSWDLRNETC